MKSRADRLRRTPRLFSRRRELLVHGVLAGLWLSGALWLVLHYFLRRAGEFGVLPHPLEPWVLKLHGAFAFATLGIGGLLWAVHIVPMWLRGHRRPSGIAITALFALLALSGYLLYYTGDEDLRAGIALLHWLAGLVALLPMLVHVLRRRRYRLDEAPRVAGQQAATRAWRSRAKSRT